MPGRDELLEWLRYQLEIRRTLGKDKTRKGKEGNNLANTRLGKRDPLDGTYKAIKADRSKEKGIKTFNSGVPTDQSVRAIKDPFGGLALDWKNVTDEESIETEKLIGEVLIAYKYKLFVYLSILFKVIRENDPTPCTCTTYIRYGNRCFPVCDGTGTTLEECLVKPEPPWPDPAGQPNGRGGGGYWCLFVGYKQGSWNGAGYTYATSWSPGSFYPTYTEELSCISNRLDYVNHLAPASYVTAKPGEFPDAYSFSSVWYYFNLAMVPQLDKSQFSQNAIVALYKNTTSTGGTYQVDSNGWFLYQAFNADVYFPETQTWNAPDTTAYAICCVGKYIRVESAVSPPGSVNGVSCSGVAIIHNPMSLVCSPWGPSGGDSLCADPGQGKTPIECPFPREKRSITYYLGGSKKTPCQCFKFNYSDPHRLYFSAIDGETKNGELSSKEIIRILCGVKIVKTAFQNVKYYCRQYDVVVQGSKVGTSFVAYDKAFPVIPEDWRNSLLQWNIQNSIDPSGKPYIDENRDKTNVNIISFENGSVTTHALINFEGTQLIDGNKFTDLIGNEIAKDKVVLKVSHFIGETKDTTTPVEFKTTDKVYGLLDAKQGITKYDIVGYSGYVANIGKVTLSPVGYSSPVYAKSSLKPKKELTLVEDISILKGWKFVIALVKDRFYCGFMRELTEDKTEYQYLDIVVIKNAQKDAASNNYANPKLPNPNPSNPVDAFFQSYKAANFPNPDKCFTNWLDKEGAVFIKKSGAAYKLTDVDFDQKLPLNAKADDQEELRDYLLTAKGKVKIKVKNVSLSVQGNACSTDNTTEKTVEIFGLELSEEEAKKLELIKIAFYTP